MSDEQEEQRYRLAAAECLEEANRTADQHVRRRLLIIAQYWFELANAVFAKRQQFQSPGAEPIPDDKTLVK